MLVKLLALGMQTHAQAGAFAHQCAICAMSGS